MADHISSAFPSNQPVVSPYASASHSRHSGNGSRSLRRSSRWIASPLLFIALLVTLLVAFSKGASSPTSHTTKASQTNVTITHTAPTTTTVPVTTNSSTTAPTITTPPATTKSDASNTSSVNTQVTINGQAVPVPPNGTVQQSTTSPDGTTNSYSISTSTNGSGSNSTFSSTSLSVTSSSDASGGTSGYTLINGIPSGY